MKWNLAIAPYLAINFLYKSIFTDLLHNWLVAKYDSLKDRPARAANGRRMGPFNRLLHVTDTYNSMLVFWDDRMRFEEDGGVGVDKYSLDSHGLHLADQRSVISAAFVRVINYEYSDIHNGSFRRLIRAGSKQFGIKVDDIYAALRSRHDRFLFHPCFRTA